VPNSDSKREKNNIRQKVIPKGVFEFVVSDPIRNCLRANIDALLILLEPTLVTYSTLVHKLVG